MNKRPLFAAATGFVLGEVCAWLAESGRKTIGWYGAAVLVLVCVAGIFCWKMFFAVPTEDVSGDVRRKISRGVHGKFLPWMLLLFCVFLLGYGRMNREIAAWKRIEKRLPEDGEAIVIGGKVEEIRDRETMISVILKTEKTGKILVYLENQGAVFSETGENKEAEKLPIGIYAEVKGEVKHFQEAGNPGQFDVRAYYRAQGISMRVFGWEMYVDKKGSYSPYLAGLFRFRRFCSRVFTEICGEEDAGIFRAAILGEKEGMDQELKDLYQKNGIAHLLAISGLHLSLIGAGIHRLLRKTGLGFGVSGVLAAGAVFSYGILTGASSSAMRAVIMLTVSFLAAYLGRTYDLLSALSLAALLLAGAHPFSITQSGFQLSFGAVLGIGLMGKLWEKGLGWEKGWRKGLSASLAVQLMTWPVMLWHYFQVPLYGILLNIIVVPLMGYVVISGLLGLGLGIWSAPAGIMAVGTGHYILALYEWLCRRASELPGYLLIWGRPEGVQIGLYYLVLAGMMILIRKEEQRKDTEREKEKAAGKAENGKEGEIRKTGGRWGSKIRGRAIAAAGLLMCGLSLRPRPQAGMDIAVLDVGQGDGIVIQCEGGKTEEEGIFWRESKQERREEKTAGNRNFQRSVILMDGGSSSDKRLGKNRLEPYLKMNGISRIDFAVVSHGDEDHISGLRYLLEECKEIRIGALILPEAGVGDEGYETLIAAADRRRIPVGYMDAGDWIRAGACRLVCFYPGEGMDADFSDRNQQSLIIRADYEDFRMLFTGDAGQEGERMALAFGGEDAFSSVQVLKAGHHGSRFSSGEDFLAAVHPAWTVISYQEGNSYGHPHEETLERLNQEGSTILETGKMGAVLLHVEKGKAYYRGYSE